MPKYHGSRSIKVDASIEKVFNSLANLAEWKEWSPWLIQEPEAKVSTAEDHKTHEWEGKRLGHGKLTVVKEMPNNRIDYVLEYFKPWKSVSDTTFLLEADSDGTKVTWSMDGKLPIFLFWMKSMMKAYLGMDYERGLNMFKDYMELGAPNTQLNFLGENDFPGFDYVGVKRYCSIEEMKEFMPKDIKRLENFLSEQDAIAGVPFSMYHKWKMVKGMASYTTGFPVNKDLNDLPSDFIKSSIPPTNTYCIEHVGEYKYLGNAWITLGTMTRNKEIKSKRGIHPFEIYIDDPNEVEGKDLRTKVYFAIK